MTPKPHKLINITTKEETYDRLHLKAKAPGICDEIACLGSTMLPKFSNNDPRPKDEILDQARDFLQEYYTSLKKFPSDEYTQRWNSAEQSIESTGTYHLTSEELNYGAKLAWRNAPRCIGRIQWSKLHLFDARNVTTTRQMFEAICTHIKYATNNGNIRSAITVFPQRTDGKHDYKVWNQQLINHAGYRDEDGTITGDPNNVEFTDLCRHLGWKGKGGKFDILPLILSAGGEDPECFEIPEEIILRVPITHPTYKEFEDLGITWFAVPAVSGMMFDCGGIQFTGAPFNGWYMSSEIGARNICDPHRYNLMEDIAEVMGLDTNTNTSLWKDKAMVEANVAVLHSFQKVNATIMDHHTASESFVKHYDDENRLRGGCPADWVWIVPPISGSLTEVFHMEMSLYYLKPSYEYQAQAWRTHVWKSANGFQMDSSEKKREIPLKFKNVARAVRLAMHLSLKVMSKRENATILYASETGKSEKYAKKLAQVYGIRFNVKVQCMIDYDFSNISNENLLLLVTSTFGNGDAPDNGELFGKKLFSMKDGRKTKLDKKTKKNKIDDNNNTMKNLQNMEEPLRKIKYGVFALGSTAYPNFCEFGKSLDRNLKELGGTRITEVGLGDELLRQEASFNQWASVTFKAGCQTFKLNGAEQSIKEAEKILNMSKTGIERVRLRKAKKETDLVEGLAKAYSAAKDVRSSRVLFSRNLHPIDESEHETERSVTIQVGVESDLKYEPGDHLAVFPRNRGELVNGILKKIKLGSVDPDQPYEILKQIQVSKGAPPVVEPHPQLPAASIRTLLTRYLDITTPPTQDVLGFLTKYVKDADQKERIEHLAKDADDYLIWRDQNYPNILEVLEEFSSLELDPALVNQLPILQPRFYSISSSPLAHAGQIHLTAALVVYSSRGGDGPTHYGVCSNYLNELKSNDEIYCFVRTAKSFHLPSDTSRPVIMVGPGTGVAPFRGFWHERKFTRDHLNQTSGEMSMFFGCRRKVLDLYKAEKRTFVDQGILSNSYVALSREPSLPKTYVQDILAIQGQSIYDKIDRQNGHFYVCGDCTMADGVAKVFQKVLRDYGNMTKEQANTYLLKMRNENRYHEDIFGVAFKTINSNKQTKKIQPVTQQETKKNKENSNKKGVIQINDIPKEDGKKVKNVTKGKPRTQIDDIQMVNGETDQINENQMTKAITQINEILKKSGLPQINDSQMVSNVRQIEEIPRKNEERQENELKMANIIPQINGFDSDKGSHKMQLKDNRMINYGFELDEEEFEMKNGNFHDNKEKRVIQSIDEVPTVKGRHKTRHNGISYGKEKNPNTHFCNCC